MPTLPIRNTVPPSVASTFTNGGPVPQHLLRDVGDGLGPMLVLPSLGMQALHLLAAEQGFYVETTGRGRSLSLQTSTFLNRYTPSYNQLVNSTANSRVCVLDQRNIHPQLVPGHRWYIKRGQSAAASPGTSPHGKWVADDMSQEYDGDPATDPVTEAFIRWLVPIAKSLGFAWSLQSEPWHVQWISGDVLPPLVIRTLDRYNIPIPGHEGQPTVAQSFQFYDGPPGHLFDSRDEGAKFEAGVARTIPLFERPLNCVGVAVNIGVDEPEGDGFIAAWTDGEWDGRSIQNFTDATRATSGHKNIALAADGSFLVMVPVAAHVFIDVDGYWLE